MKSQIKKEDFLWFVSRVMILVSCLILLNGIFEGITTKPTELDSLGYHIPIAKSILNGTVFKPTKTTAYHRYFPGSSEAILSIFMLLHIPLNLYNVLGIVVFGISLYLLGRQNKFSSPYAIIFAISLAGMVGVSRWMNVQIIDIWLAAWFTFSLLLAQRPQTTLSYFLKLGFCLGMLVGSKYSGPLYAGLLYLFYGKKITNKISLRQIVSFSIPFSLAGLFWYARNYIVMGNPVYPLSFCCLPGIRNFNLHFPVWRAVLKYPLSMASALLSEYGIWSLSLFVAPLILGYQTYKKHFVDPNIKLIAMVAFWAVIIYGFLPSDITYSVHVSNLRYGFPVILLFVFVVFSFARQYGKEELCAYIGLTSLLFSLRVAYHPKLLLFLIPICLFVFFPEYLTRIIHRKN